MQIKLKQNEVKRMQIKTKHSGINWYKVKQKNERITEKIIKVSQFKAKWNEDKVN